MGPPSPTETAGSTCIVTLLCSLVVTAVFLAIGVLLLAFPSVARKMIYPCLSHIEDGTPSASASPLEGDAVRLAGACFLSVAVSCLGLLMPLLPCCQYEKDDAGNATLSSHFFLRTLLFIQASMGLALVGIGLVNLTVSEDEHIYDDFGRHQCSSVKDQTILWTGVGVLCLTSLGLMFSFWPSQTIESNGDDPTMQYTERPGQQQRCCCMRFRCCCKRNRRTSPAESDNLEPLLAEEDRDESQPSGEGPDVAVSETNEPIPPTSNEESGDAASDAEEQSTSRLRGTCRLLKLAGNESAYLWVGIFVLLVRLPFSLAIPHFVSTTIANLIDEDYDGAKREVLLLFLLGTVDSILDYWCIFLFGKAKENIVRAVRTDTFTSILRQDQSFFDKTNTGDLVSRLTADCGEMAGDLTWFFRFSVEALVRISGISIYMVLRSPVLGLCTVAIVPFVGVINKFYGDWLGKNAQGVQSALAAATTVAHESLASIKTVITLGSEEKECEKYKTHIETLYDLNIRQLIATGIYFMAVSTFLINTVVQATLLLLGSIFVEQGKLTPEILLAFMLYQGQHQEYTLNLFQSYSSLVKSSGSEDRVFYLLDRHPPPPGTGNLIVQSFETDADEVTTSQDVVLDKVSFAYPTRPDTLALNQMSATINSGSLVALVGHSGCGKSTVVSMLERLYDPQEGRIKFGSVDLRMMNLKAHRAKIGLVTQDPVLFSGTIEENIAYGTSATFEEVVMVSRVANAHHFIDSFPNKYNEQVGERGQALSGGQKQRIAIARALIRRPALLLLDEATSALDPESEAAVQEALNALLRNRFGMTTVVIAHRLQTVRSADTIFVMKDGQVVEQGSHDHMGRHLLAFSLVAGSLLVAESLAIHQSPLQQSHGALARFGRRRAPSWRLGAVDDRKSSATVLLASSPSQTSEDSAEIVDAISHGDEETPIQLTSTTHEHAAKSASEEEKVLSIWPRMDDLDKRMMKIALPCIANFAINPLIGAVDLFWVNRMGDALAVAGQSAANQVFSSAFWIVSVLPSVTATLVSKANASGNQEELQDAVSQALVVGFYISLAGSLLMLRYPERVLSSALKDGAPALQYAKPYLFIRAFAFLPSLISLIGFSAFRGTLDTSTPLKISAISNVFNAVLDPILMFTMAMGVPGAALATLAAEVISAASFLFLMLRRKMIRWSKIFQLPSWTKLKPLLEGGAALQMRNVALNLTFLAVARVTQSLDDTGVAAAAHALAIQCFQVGGIVLLALSVVAQTIVPNELIEKVDASTGKRHGGKRAAKNVVNRLMSWGFVLGVGLGALQMALLPVLRKSSPLEEVRQAAVIPSILASVYQIMNGLVFIGEGVMVGCGNFLQLSLTTVVATVAALISLNFLPNAFGLTGVWMSFGVFNSFRLAGVWLHQTRYGPLSERALATELN